MKELDGDIVISRVLCGGAADRCGMLRPGDVLHEINGRELTGLNVDDVADIMVIRRPGLVQEWEATSIPQILQLGSPDVNHSLE